MAEKRKATDADGDSSPAKRHQEENDAEARVLRDALIPIITNKPTDTAALLKTLQAMNELPQTLSKETVTELCEVVVQAKRLKVGSVLVKLAVDLLIKWKKLFSPPPHKPAEISEPAVQQSIDESHIGTNAPSSTVVETVQPSVTELALHPQALPAESSSHITIPEVPVPDATIDNTNPSNPINSSSTAHVEVPTPPSAPASEVQVGEQPPPPLPAAIVHAEQRTAVVTVNDPYYSMSKEERDELKKFFQDRKEVKYYCTISSTDIKDIRNYKFISCDYIDTYLNWITDVANEKRRKNGKSGGALYLCSYWFQAYVMTRTSSNPVYVQRKRMKMAYITMPRYNPNKGGLPADVISYEMVVIPIFTGPLKGGHWAMAILIPATGRLLVYDSADPRHKRDWTVVRDAVSEWREIMMRKRNRSAPAVYVEVHHGLQQDNEYNCGIYALLWAKKWVLQEPDPDIMSQPEVHQFRKELASKLDIYVDKKKEERENIRARQLKKRGVKLAPPPAKTYKLDSDTDDYDESILVEDDEEPAIVCEEGPDEEVVTPARTNAKATKHEENAKSIARKDLQLAKQIMQKKQAEKKKPPPKVRSKPTKIIKERSASPVRPDNWPSGPIAYVDSHIPFTNPENPDRNRSCDRCDDPAEVECQKCHCSPLVWRCLKCFQYHASKDAKIRRLANRMANAPEGDGYESDSSE